MEVKSTDWIGRMKTRLGRLRIDSCITCVFTPPNGSEDLTSAPSKQERAELAEVLFKCSGPFKRAVSPLLPWPAVLGYLCGELRDCRLGSPSQEECLHAFAMRMEEPAAKAFLDDLARRIRADPAAFGGEAGLVKDDWIEQFQQQVDYVPGFSKGKRLVDDVEMGSYLELGKQMKANGNESFARRDFDFAFTRCVPASAVCLIC